MRAVSRFRPCRAGSRRSAIGTATAYDSEKPLAGSSTTPCQWRSEFLEKSAGCPWLSLFRLCLAFQRHNVSRLAAGEPGSNALGHLIAERADRIIGPVHIAPSHRKVFVAQQVADEEGIRARLPGI